MRRAKPVCVDVSHLTECFHSTILRGKLYTWARFFDCGNDRYRGNLIRSGDAVGGQAPEPALRTRFVSTTFEGNSPGRFFSAVPVTRISRFVVPRRSVRRERQNRKFSIRDRCRRAHGKEVSCFRRAVLTRKISSAAIYSLSAILRCWSTREGGVILIRKAMAPARTRGFLLQGQVRDAGHHRACRARMQAAAMTWTTRRRSRNGVFCTSAGNAHRAGVVLCSL